MTMTRVLPRGSAALGLAIVMVAVLGGCRTDPGPPPQQPTASSPTDLAPAEGSATPAPTPEVAPPRTSGLVYYAGRRARTGELLLFAETVPRTAGATVRDSLLLAVRAATTGPPLDPDYRSLWSDITVDKVKLYWDGDEGNYSVRLGEDTSTRRPRGMSMREAHLAIQQVVWTLHSIGGPDAPVAFQVGDDAEPVTDVFGVPATGPFDTYLPADYAGVLSAVNILTVENTATSDGQVRLSGLAESFEATVGVRVERPDGTVLVETSAQAEECCGRLFAWSVTLDASGWGPGVYTVMALTDDPIGIAQGSDGPEIDTKTITIS